MTFETFYQSDGETWPDQIPTYLPIYLPNYLCTSIREHPKRSYHRDLRHLRHWLQYWQLRTWIHDNTCYLAINCDTGQHSEFLRCFYWCLPFNTPKIKFVQLCVWNMTWQYISSPRPVKPGLKNRETTQGTSWIMFWPTSQLRKMTLLLWPTINK